VIVGSAFGIPVPLGKQIGYLVDSDLDGVVGSEGDGIVAPGCRTAAVWAQEIWSAEGGVRLVRGSARGTWSARAMPPAVAGDKDRGAAWNVLQWRRQQGGFFPLVYDASLEPGLEKHLVYLDRTGEEGHQEDPSKAAYSKEGDAAGQESVLDFGPSTCLEGVNDQFETLLHRQFCIAAELARAAMLVRKKTFGMRMVGAYDGPLAGRVCVFPSHGMADVPPRLMYEVPMPIEGTRAAMIGTGVAVSSRVWLMRTVKSPPKLTLSALSPNRASVTPVDATFRWWGGSFAPSEDVVKNVFETSGLIVLLPKRPLVAGGLYECVVEFPQAAPNLGGETFAYRWEFTVGR
jgi:hypothetical protein